jgi:hypothetical protein
LPSSLKCLTLGMEFTHGRHGLDSVTPGLHSLSWQRPGGEMLVISCK